MLQVMISNREAFLTSSLTMIERLGTVSMQSLSKYLDPMRFAGFEQAKYIVCVAPRGAAAAQHGTDVHRMDIRPFHRTNTAKDQAKLS